jgi:hypothetical protein
MAKLSKSAKTYSHAARASESEHPICLYLKNPKWWPKIKITAKVRFLTQKSTEKPPTEQTLNYFWMQFIQYWLKKYFKPLKCSLAKSKMTPETQITFFRCQLTNFHRLKHFCALSC